MRGPWARALVAAVAAGALIALWRLYRKEPLQQVLAGFVGALVGLYGLFDAAAPPWLGWPMLAVGTTLAVVGMHQAGRRSVRTARVSAWLTVSGSSSAASAGDTVKVAIRPPSSA